MSPKLILSLLAPAVVMYSARPLRVGGQAIIEGVMMRGKGRISWAVRNGKGEVLLEAFPYASWARRHKLFRKPILRGGVGLIESLILGLRGLSRSAELAVAKDTVPVPAMLSERVASAVSISISLFLTFLFFFYLPLKALSLLVPTDSALLYNLLAGVLRIAFFLLYLTAITLLKDIRRLFEYHGAEHKVINAYEAGEALTVAAARPCSTRHPRCGTSLLLMVALLSILLFGLIDGLVIRAIGPYPTVLARTLTHIAIVPVVSGVSYEVLRLSNRFRRAAVMRWMALPGLWLQRVTTRQPDDGQLAVALRALHAIL